jgi:hypothetical protein
MTRPCTLDVATDVRDVRRVAGTAQDAVTMLLVDGVDILEREEPHLRPDGTRREYPRWYHPVDPVELLPPESRRLLPTSHPALVMIGVCGCEEPGCGSLWMSLRREHDTVIWEPTPDSPRGSIQHEYRFTLRQYLDALDNVTHRAPEDPSRRIARELRAQRDSLFGLSVPGRVLDILAWPGRAQIRITVVRYPAVDRHEIPVGPTTTTAEVVEALDNARRRLERHFYRSV